MKTIIIAALLAVSLAACGNHSPASSTQPATATPNTDHARFAVALGSFSDAATAQSWVDKLKAAGIPAYTETITRADGTTVTDLRSGPFDSSADASASIAKVRQTGLMSADAGVPSPPTRAQVAAPAPNASNCAFEGDTAGNAAKYADVEGERERLRTARAQGDAMQAANIKAIFENPEIQKLSSDDVADLAEKACLSGTDLSTYKSPTLSVASVPASDAGMAPTFEDMVHRRVGPNIVWNGSTEGLVTVIAVHCSPNGAILSAEVKAGSGNAGWDAAALQAVQRSDPMPLDADGHTPATFDITMRPAG